MLVKTRKIVEKESGRCSITDYMRERDTKYVFLTASKTSHFETEKRHAVS
jgi:hypothetical protein